MDPSIPHHLRKIRLDIAAAPPRRRQGDSEHTPPPAYTAKPEPQHQQQQQQQQQLHHQINTNKQIECHEDLEVEEEEDEEDDTPHEITIDASTAISGSFNVLQIDVAAQGARLAAALASLLREPNNPAFGGAHADPQDRIETTLAKRRPVKISVNCGVKILGQRNVVGVPQAVQPASIMCANGNGPSEVGVKRKADEIGDVRTASPAKFRAGASGDRLAT